LEKMRNNASKGFTLIELLVAVAVAAIILTSLGSVFWQLSSGHAQTTNRQDAVNQVQNAVQRLSNDIQMAQKITVLDNAGSQRLVDAVSKTVEFDFAVGDALKIRWVDWDAGVTEVTYKVTSGTLMRTNSITPLGQTDPTVTHTLIARNISGGLGTWNTNVNALSLNITSTSGGYEPASETRTIQIFPRPVQ
jgi:prepilin-type N-terminal cleavage/methylation domain-containing protein